MYLLVCTHTHVLTQEKEVMQAINSTTQLPEAKHTESHLLADKDRRQMVRKYNEFKLLVRVRDVQQ
jgi:hypothetical protein